MTEQLNPYTKGFVALNIIVFLGYCVMAAFFPLYGYLSGLPIDQRFTGLLIGLFSLAVVIVRPFVSPFMHPDNARRWITLSCAGVIVCLMLYAHVTSLWGIAVLRTVHGSVHAVFAAATLTAAVAYIPPEKSGQSFALLTLVAVLPMACVPPIVTPMMAWVGTFPNVLDVFAGILAVSFPLLLLVGNAPSASQEALPQDSGLRDLWLSLRDRDMVVVLLLAVVVWLGCGMVFYYLEGYGRQLSVANPGWFFTLSTIAEAGVRLVGGRFLDRVSKRWIVAASMAWMGVGYFVLAGCESPEVFYATGFMLGIAWGVSMPAFTGLAFDLSPPRYRALNANLVMQSFQMGFFFGPLLGGTLFVHLGYSGMFTVCGILALAGVAATALPWKRG